MKQAYTWGAIVVDRSGIDHWRRSAFPRHEAGGRRRCSSGGEVGLWAVLGRVLRNLYFLLGILAMTVAFYSLLFGLSWGDVSLIAPASASLTFVTNADCGQDVSP